MKLCDEAAIREMIQIGALAIDVEGNAPILFLDDFRVGLRLHDEATFFDGPLDLRAGSPPLRRLSLRAEGLSAGQWALGTSLERLSLPANVLGILNTRSKYARLGLEMLRSSCLVAPGFGGDGPTSIIFEMQARIPVLGFSEDQAYAFLMLFRLDEAVKLSRNDYGGRFPFNIDKPL